ncbi:hypothetical protein RCG67_05790 [Kocuria sp. CPCC 205292]|uniref:hypothetical protein n=1 Tax=Kocuria cellulosilytica TaxID=3071451 RepID=UPI0034D73DCC
MTGTSLPDTPTAEDFRALARSSPWRFSTLHFTHRQQVDRGSTASGEPAEAWLDRRLGRLVVRSAGEVEVAEGPPYGEAVSAVACRDDGVACAGPPSSPTPAREPELVLRPDGLVARRPEDWHYDHGDPLWQDYRWTAMLDPAELSRGVDVSDVLATTLRGRPTWSATCRPLLGDGEEWENGYTPRCGCCPLLESRASRILEYGPEDPTLTNGDLATVYRVHLDVRTGVVVDITPLDGVEGTALSNELHAVDAPLDPPVDPPL